MSKRGTKPKGKVLIKWSANFAYGLGLIASDGNLARNGRHVLFVSTDLEQIHNFLNVFKIKNIKIAGTTNGYYKSIKAFRVQFSDVLFHDFLVGIGMTPNKSKTIGEINIPKKYFFDFLRGSFDGDGCFYSYWDPRWKSSHMFYLTFSSASQVHILWLQKEIYDRSCVGGHISKSKHKGSIYNLRYAKREALEIIKKMYYNPHVVCLSRKKLKIDKALAVESRQQKLYFSKILHR